MTYTLDPPLPATETPDDYHRVHFDPSQLPSRRIVGLLACQRDPLLRTLKTKVLSAKPASLSAPPPPKGKIPKSKSKTSTPAGSSTPTSGANGSTSANGSGAATPSGKLWEIELEDTVIFPEGGGQPFDTGRIVFGQYPNDNDNGVGAEEREKKEFIVEGCLRRKLDSVHLVRIPEGTEEGWLQRMEGRECEVSVDWERRVDHMSIHTAQHLLSAILDVYAEGLPTLSWSMQPFPTLDPPYIELPRGLTWEEVQEVESKCNAAIEKSTKIWVDVTIQQEGFVKETANGVRENRGIPSDYTDGVIRHINILDIDKNACCGTQLPHLGHLKFIHVLPPATPQGAKPSKGISRVYFTAGPRGVKYLQEGSRALTSASQLLGVGRTEVVERMGKMEDQRKEVLSREKDLRGELAKLIGENAIASGSGGGKQKVVWMKRTEKSTHDYEFLGGIIVGINTAVPVTEGDNKPSSPNLIIVTSTPPGLTPSLLIINSPTSPDLAKKVHERLKADLEGLEGGKGRYKGGGAKGRYMCKVDGKWGKAEDAIVKRVVDEVESDSDFVNA